MPLLPCPHCDQSVEVAISQAGSETTCGSCQQVLLIPKLGELRRLASESANKLPESGSRTSVQASAGSAKRLFFAVLLGIAGIATLVGLFCLFRYLAIEVPATTADHIAEVTAIYNNVPAGQLVREWQQMEKFDLDATGPYKYKRLQVEKAAWGAKGLAAVAVIVLAMSIALIIAKADKKSIATE